MVINAVFFLNCSRTSFDSQDTNNDPKLGGGGIDGKMYYSYGNCEPTKIDVVASVSVSADFKSAWMISEDCKSLSRPRNVDANKIKISADDKSSLILEGRAYSIDAFSDGKQKAPVAPVQYPNLLAGYALRPAWTVAGVDYAVGVPAGTVLKDPATISMAGVTLNAAGHQVIVTGDNVVLNGYDFSLNGGWSVRINGAANTRIVNSRFIETAAQADAPISTDTAATNLYVGYTTIDGGGTAANPNDGSLISMSGRGLITEYCWLKNAPSNIFNFGFGGAGAGGEAKIRFNLVEDSGRRGGGGGNYLIINSGSYSHFQVVFNTSYQTPGQTGAQGWNVDATAGVQTAEIGNNVMITTAAGAASYLTSVGPNTGAGVVHDNYFDLRGAFGFAYPGTSAFASYGPNFDMINGQTLTATP